LGGLLARVVLGDPAHCNQPGGLTGQQEPLELAEARVVTAQRGSVDPRLESGQLVLQEEPRQAVPAIRYWHGLNSVSRLYPPDNRAHVSVSPGFPRGVGFLGNPTAVRLTVGTCSENGERARGYFVPLPRLMPGVGPDSPPGDLWDARPGFFSPWPQSPFPFGPSL